MLCLSVWEFNTIKKNEKSNFNDARCSINAFFLRREENVQKCDGTSFVASPYGWANKEKQIDGVDYEINVPNIILSVIFSETIVCPVVLTAVELWEPVNYTEPNATK
nr:MAG TPA: hypothetical protein [Caudoviricetes sp.]